MVKRTMGWVSVVAGLAALLLAVAGAGDGASAWDRSRGGFRDHGVHGPRRGDAASRRAAVLCRAGAAGGSVLVLLPESGRVLPSGPAVSRRVDPGRAQVPV